MAQLVQAQWEGSFIFFLHLCFTRPQGESLSNGGAAILSLLSLRHSLKRTGV